MKGKDLEALLDIVGWCFGSQTYCATAVWYVNQPAPPSVASVVDFAKTYHHTPEDERFTEDYFD